MEYDIIQTELSICQGAITEIRSDVEWRYMSCTTCKSGLQDVKTCIQCNKLIEYPMQRYRLMTTISDGVNSAKLVLFDKEAEKVIGKPINKLLDLYEKEDGKEKVFHILQECIGKEYAFKVKVGMSKFGNERELKGQKTMPANSGQEEPNNANHEKEQVLKDIVLQYECTRTTKETDMAWRNTNKKRHKAADTTTSSNTNAQRADE